MTQGRLGHPEPGSIPQSLSPDPPKNTRMKLLLILPALMITAAACAAVAVAVHIHNRGNSHGGSPLHSRPPSQAISRACGLTIYQNHCLSSLSEFPGTANASLAEFANISVNAALQKFGGALRAASEISSLNMDPIVRSAYDACIELLEDSVSLLSRSLAAVAGGGGSAHDVKTWLSASLTNHNTCTDGFEEVSSGEVKDQMAERLKDLSELVSNSLAIFVQAAQDGEFSGVPVSDRLSRRRRRLLAGVERAACGGFPAWLSRRDRKLLEAPAAEIKADIVVSPDGNGTCRTIEEAIEMAPENSAGRFIIHVRAGRYEESTLKVGRLKTNLMFVGDGANQTIITGNKSVFDNITTFHTASFGASGDGLILRDIKFENTAGPSNHQAVALRVGADHAVIYRCIIMGYQDTLYAHSLRQFYRESDIYGTVDFIFGNAAVVFQNCNIYARNPLPLQKNTITAQGRVDPFQNTGISIHNCSILPEPNLSANLSTDVTYLGRPWKLYSRTVYMLSNMGDLINPSGWLEWNSSFALNTLYYGEYKNYGPGSNSPKRVNWTGYHETIAQEDANNFTVATFLSGLSWLPSTSVPFVGGLETGQ